MQALIGAGYTDLAQSAAFLGSEAYSFVFDGQRGTLDYGLASASILDNITGVAEWHINADEPDLLNYDESFNDSRFYNVDPFAASDHDPLIIGLTLDEGSSDPQPSDYDNVFIGDENHEPDPRYKPAKRLDRRQGQTVTISTARTVATTTSSQAPATILVRAWWRRCRYLPVRPR